MKLMLFLIHFAHRLEMVVLLFNDDMSTLYTIFLFNNWSSLSFYTYNGTIW